MNSYGKGVKNSGLIAVKLTFFASLGCSGCLFNTTF